MPLITPPALQGIAPKDSSGQGLHVVTLAYDFFGDAVQGVQLGALQFSGSSYEFDPSSLSNTGLGSIKSIGFSASFGDNNDLDIENGSQFIYALASQQLITLSPLIATDTTVGVTTGSPTKSMSGVLSLVTHKSSKIIFARAVNQPSNTLFGEIYVSLYDFAVPPFVTTGYGWGIPIG